MHHTLMYYLVNSKTLSSLLLPPPHPPPLFLPLPLPSPSLPLPQRRGRRYTRVFKRKEPIEACIEIEGTGSHDYRVRHVCLSSHHAGDKGTARLYFKSEGFLGGPPRDCRKQEQSQGKLIIKHFQDHQLAKFTLT